MRVGLFVDAYIPEINGVVTSTKTLCDALINKGDEVYIYWTIEDAIILGCDADEEK